MNVGVMGVNFINKGAELMLMSIIQEVSSWPDPPRVALPLHTGSRSNRSAAGVHHLVVKVFRRMRMLDPLIMVAGNLVPSGLARRLELVRARDLDLLLDASGFAYSDQWGLARMQQHARLYRSLSEAGTPIVLMPQAFGPFESRPRRTAFREIAESAALIFARDDRSAAYARDAAPGVSVTVAPDFTARASSRLPPPLAQSHAGRACVIPNVRMLDKLPSSSHAWYLRTLADAFGTLRARGLAPYVLLVERGDRRVLDELGRVGVGIDDDVLHLPDPLNIKSVIGAAHVVVGSRYHGLVSGLGQGVPSVGIGWSHKYDALFEEYGCPEMLVRMGSPIDDALSIAVDGDGRDALIGTLVERGALVAERTSTMWNRIRDLVGDDLPAHAHAAS